LQKSYKFYKKKINKTKNNKKYKICNKIENSTKNGKYEKQRKCEEYVNFVRFQFPR